MQTFRQFIGEADYCSGLSINADFWWDEKADVSFLTMGQKQNLITPLMQAIHAGKMQVVDQRLSSYGNNPNFGFTYLVVLGQSHVILHTWPEKHMMNIDAFTCGSEGDPNLILSHLKNSLKPKHIQMNQNTRGIRKDIENGNEIPDTPKDLKKG